MRVTADTNVLVRLLTGDDLKQSKIARDALEAAELVAIPTPVLCELVWVLRRGYGLSAVDIADAIRDLIESPTARVDRPTVAAGLRSLRGGGDFADGAIAFEGALLGGTTFLSFDRKAVAEVLSHGEEAVLL